MSNVRRWVGFSLVVMLSLLLPGFVALAGLGYFLLTSMDVYVSPVFKDGSIWYTEYVPLDLNWMDGAPYSCELKHRNLTTGVEESTGVRLKDEYASPLWVGDDCYLISSSAVYLCSNASINARSPQTPQYVAAVPPHPGATFDSTLFVYNGEVTTLSENVSGECILLHLRDRLWVPGEKVLLPPPNCRWVKTAEGRHLISPQPSSPSSSIMGISAPVGISISAPPSLAGAAAQIGTTVLPGVTSTVTTTTTMPVPVFMPPSMWTLRIVQDGDRLHLLYSDLDGFCAYRTGLEPVTDEEGISALVCENQMRDPNGWEPVPDSPNVYVGYDQMVCDRDGLLINSSTGSLIRRSLTGEWSIIQGVSKPFTYSTPHLMIDSSEKVAYLQAESGEVYRVDGNSLKPTTFKVRDVYARYLGRWIWLGFSLFAAWLLHYLIMTLGTLLLLRGTEASEYEFGNQSVRLASVLRRGIAAIFDGGLLLFIISLSIWGHGRLMGLSHKSLDRMALVNLLTTLEDNLIYDTQQAALSLVDALLGILPFSLVESGDQSSLSAMGLIVLVMVFFDTIAVLWFFKVFDEGRYGITFGKWLLGIRTVRSTLRPAGFARALVRDILLTFDLLGMLTPIPAATSMMFSSTRQRLGDRVADTIVIHSTPGKSTLEQLGRDLTVEPGMPASQTGQ